MYSRADLSRTGTIVVALFLAAMATNAVARGFCAADAQSEDHPSVQVLRHAGPLVAEKTALEEQSRRQAEAAGVVIVADFDGRPFEAGMPPICETVQGDPAPAALIERLRKVE